MSFKIKGSTEVSGKLKLNAEDINRALTVDANGELTSSDVTSTELSQLSGVTGPIQTQLDNNDTAITDHIADTSDAHDASAISNVPAGNLAATDVQAALNELQSDVDTRALDADVIKKDGSVDFTADQSMGGNQLTNLGAPSASSDAATKSYVDSVAEGLKPKTAARVATTADITLSGPQTIDGVSAIAGDRVLVKDQTLAENNGIYVVAAGAWSRSADFDSLTPIDEVNGAMVAVQEGTSNAGKVFVQSGAVATIGTDPINFIFFNSSSSLVGGDGITVSGSNVSVDHDGQGLTFVATQLALELDGATLSKSATGLKVSDSGITETQLADNAVSESKLNTEAVSTVKIQDLAVTTGKLDNSAVSTAKIANLAVEEAKLADNAVTTVKIDASAVTTEKINNEAVTNPKLGLGAVLSSNINGFALDQVTIGGGDGTPLSTIPGGIDHDALLNFVANEHVDHSSVQIATAANTSGLTGGGNITATRNLSVDIMGTTLASGNADDTDELLVQRPSEANALKSMTRGSFLNGIARSSPGDINYTDFPINNNQVSPSNVTGLVFGGAVNSFTALVSANITADTNLNEVFTLTGIRRATGGVTMSITSTGDDSLVNFTINSTIGQVQYTTPSYAGFVDASVKFRAITLES